MHLYFGDTTLHLALKWKRHRAFKAMLSLYPDWMIPNGDGITAQELALQVYGRDIATLKEEQEREYENDAMLVEENEMTRCGVVVGIGWASPLGQLYVRCAMGVSDVVCFLSSQRAPIKLKIEKVTACLNQHNMNTYKRYMDEGRSRIPGEEKKNPPLPCRGGGVCPTDRESFESRPLSSLLFIARVGLGKKRKARKGLTSLVRRKPGVLRPGFVGTRGQ